MYQFRTQDHPEANGREPQDGDVQYPLFFRLEDGNVLNVLIGRRGFEGLKEVIRQMEQAEAAEVPH